MTTSTITAVIGLALAWPQAARAAGVVTACNEAGLKAALFGGGTVTFTCSGTITVLGGTIVISQHTEIDGRGHKITISGGGKVQVFVVDSGAALYLSNITVANGNSTFSGGGLLNNGGLVKVTNSSFISNGAFAYGGGISNNGGGLEVSNSSFSSNAAEFGGGGISMNGGILLMDGCEFDNNISSPGNGGGIYNTAPIMQIVNSTFYNNHSDGSGANIFNSGGALLLNTTLAGAPGSLDNLVNQGSVLLENTILSGVSTGTFFNCSGSITDGGGNLRWPTSDPTCVGSYGDPMLGPLQPNGGPTKTMALLTGSAAIDTAVDALCPATDQRGVIRPQGPHCDIGAYEANTAFTLGAALKTQLTALLPLLSLDAMRSLSDRVITPLENSLNPNLWPPTPIAPEGDGNHVNSQTGSQVFTNQRDVVDTLSSILIDPTQVAYIKNLVMADRTLAVVAMQDKGCSDSNAQACAQAAAEVAAGDESAAAGNFSDAITHYLNAWQLTKP